MPVKISPNKEANSSKSPRNPVPGRLRGELLAGEQAGFVLHQERGEGKKIRECLRGQGGARRDPAGRDAVVEIDQHLAEIEDHRLGMVVVSSSRRPSSARLRVISSANSRPVPAGSPWAMRVTFKPVAREALGQVIARGVPFDIAAERDDDFAIGSCRQPPFECGDRRSSGSTPFERRNLSAEHMVLAAKGAGLSRR